MIDQLSSKIIRRLFKLGKKLNVILIYLQRCTGHRISLSSLKRHLRRHSLRRRGHQRANFWTIVRLITIELRSCNRDIGYRQMWQVVRKKCDGQVLRETVRKVLKIVDPCGVRNRSRQRFRRRQYENPGPNFVWHIDGYDKLKAFGFEIHGAIDGFSRKIIWLSMVSSNHDPRQVADLYLDSVLFYKSCPTIIRSDCGTENSLLATLHMMQRHAAADRFGGEKSYRYGRSVFNQRIEAFWSILKKYFATWWIENLRGLQINGVVNFSNILQKDCMRVFLWGPMQRALNDFTVRWNNHTFRKQRRRTAQKGASPNELFFLSEEFGGQNYAKPVHDDVIRYGKEQTMDSSQELQVPNELKTVRRQFLHSRNIDQEQLLYMPMKDVLNLAVEFVRFVQRNI